MKILCILILGSKEEYFNLNKVSAVFLTLNQGALSLFRELVRDSAVLTSVGSWFQRARLNPGSGGSPGTEQGVKPFLVTLNVLYSMFLYSLLTAP